MKLGKSLIITGLLFSSILGSVNVGSITAMAADGGATPPVISPAPETREISVHYIDADGKQITDGEFLWSAKRSIYVTPDATKFSVSKLNLPENYKLAVDSTDINIASDVNGLDVKVVNVPRVTVDVEYPKGTTDKTLPDKLNLIDVTKQVRAGNVTLPEGYEILDYKNGKVTLQKVNNSEVQIIFVDENNKQVKTDSLKNKNILETVSAREVTAPEGYTVIPDQNAVIASQTNGGVTSYAAIINVKKNAPTATHNGSNTSVKHGSHGGYVSQKVRVSFVDQDGDEVGYQQLNGKASFDTKISAPAGYSFVNANEANIKFDKSGNKDLKLKVTKNRPVSTMEEGIVTTNSGDFKHLYTIEGKDITNRGLSGDSKWYTDQYATINGEKMFRVATNEWVKATDVYK